MKNFVFYLICKPASVDGSRSSTALPLVDAAAPSGRKNDLLLLFKTPADSPVAAVDAILAAKSRGWAPPIDPLSFFLNRADDVFRVDWNELRLLTRETFDALRARDMLVSFDPFPLVDASAAPVYSPKRLAAAPENGSAPFEYVAIGAFADFCAASNRRYYGSQTISIE